MKILHCALLLFFYIWNHDLNYPLKYIRIYIFCYCYIYILLYSVVIVIINPSSIILPGCPIPTANFGQTLPPCPPWPWPPL